MAALSARAALPSWRGSWGGAVGLVLAALAALGIAQLLPSSGLGLALKLGIAMLWVLVIPGALAQRAVGQPRQLSVALAGALVWSLGIVALGLAITVAAGRSLTLTLVVIAVASALSLGASLGVPRPASWQADAGSVAFVTLVGLLFGVAVWWVSETIQGDGLFHLGRVRKLDELPALESLGSLNEFADGGLHPGYAFPLWHAALAAVARLADVDAALVVQYGPALLVPLALVVTYAAGVALFGSWAGGVATMAAQLGLVALSRGGVGSLELLTLPPAAARLLLFPALLALVFAYLREPRRALLPSLALGALALTIVHGSYLVFACLLVGGYAVARLITEQRGSLPDLQRVIAVFAALLIPFAAFLGWLWPVLREAAAVQPDAAEMARAIERYEPLLVIYEETFRLSADANVRGGVIAIAALLTVPLFVFVMRRRYAALVVGGMLVVLLVALVPRIFAELSDLISLSQARRLPSFLPLSFAIGGAALIVARLREQAALGALILGGLLLFFYPSGETSWGAGWVVWLAIAGGLIALAAGRWAASSELAQSVLRPREAPETGIGENERGPDGTGTDRDETGTDPDGDGPHPDESEPGQDWEWPDWLSGIEPWAVVIAGALLLPVAFDGLRKLEKEERDPRTLPPRLIAEVRTQVGSDEVVFADLETSYRLVAAAPVRVAAGPPAHVAQTTSNRPFERRRAVSRFYYRPGVEDAQRLAVLERYSASWLVVDRHRDFPEELVESLEPGVFDNGQYVLIRLPR